MLEVVLNGQRRGRNVDEAVAAPEAFVGWLHQRYVLPVKLPSAGDIVSSRDTFLYIQCFYFLTINFDFVLSRRKARKSPTDGTSMNGMKAKQDDSSGRDTCIYEMATEVTGPADTLDKNGRLVLVIQADSTDGGGKNSIYADTVTFADYDTAVPVAPAKPKPRPQPRDRADKKRAARTGQQEDARAGAVDGKGSGGVAGKDGVVCDSMNDVTLVDNSLYATSSPSAAAAAAGSQPICTSINDFTLVDNAIYNK